MISTLFISGVNIDQCVYGTFNDAYYKVSLFPAGLLLYLYYFHYPSISTISLPVFLIKWF